MDLKLSSVNEQGIQGVLENCEEELMRFILDANINYPGVKAILCFTMSEHYNSKVQGDE